MAKFQSIFLNVVKVLLKHYFFFLLLSFHPKGRNLLKRFKAIVLFYLSKPVIYETVRGGPLFICFPLITLLEWN